MRRLILCQSEEVASRQGMSLVCCCELTLKDTARVLGFLTGSRHSSVWCFYENWTKIYLAYLASESLRALQMSMFD